MRITPQVRKYKQTDLDACTQLFHGTVHTINAKDYSQNQLRAWAPDIPNSDAWQKRLTNSIAYVAEYHGKLVGFGNLTQDGYFDMLYIHKDYQSKGIAVVIVKEIIQQARLLKIKRIWSDVSITAKPFCEHFGMHVVKEQTKKLHGETFINYLMEADL